MRVSPLFFFFFFFGIALLWRPALAMDVQARHQWLQHACKVGAWVTMKSYGKWGSAEESHLLLRFAGGDCEAGGPRSAASPRSAARSGPVLSLEELLRKMTTEAACRAGYRIVAAHFPDEAKRHVDKDDQPGNLGKHEKAMIAACVAEAPRVPQFPDNKIGPEPPL